MSDHESPAAAKAEPASCSHPCNCWNEIDRILAEKGCNTRLATCLVLDREANTMKARLLVATAKVDDRKRGKLTEMIASHCPFCGAKFD